ncbi:hypothetical protein C5S53_17015 [Methanophagales archaeon]|nr:hypothetical protein C5S53_17015 [Methanophagales archaeon]
MRESFRLKETFVWITADEKRHIEVAKKELTQRRRDLERFARWHPYFLVTFESYPIDETEVGNATIAAIVRRMIESAEKFGLGPMSAVAGTLAEFAVDAMQDAGATYAMVDNGGDVALITDRAILVGIYAGESPFSNKIALKIKPSASMVGICTSSGTVGHSISFGHADAATVISNSASLSDAAATALCNSATDAQSISKVFHSIDHVEGIEGALVIYKDKLATWGEIPEIARLNSEDHTNSQKSFYIQKTNIKVEEEL